MFAVVAVTVAAADSASAFAMDRETKAVADMTSDYYEERHWDWDFGCELFLELAHSCTWQGWGGKQHSGSLEG